MRRAWLPDSILNYLVPDPPSVIPRRDPNWKQRRHRMCDVYAYTQAYTCMYVCMYAKPKGWGASLLAPDELRQEFVITDVISRRLDLSMAYRALASSLPSPTWESYLSVDDTFVDYTRCLFRIRRKGITVKNTCGVSIINRYSCYHSFRI